MCIPFENLMDYCRPPLFPIDVIMPRLLGATIVLMHKTIID